MAAPRVSLVINTLDRAGLLNDSLRAARGRVVNVGSISGRVALAFSPMQATLIGTWRQP